MRISAAMDELTTEFVAETRETLERLGEALVIWEASPADAERLDEIFRFVHTVKGSCGFLDLPRIEALAHAAESALGEVREGSRAASPMLVGAMLGLIDRIATLADALESGEPVPDAAGDAALIAALDAPSVAPANDVAARPVAARNVRIAVDLLEAMMNQVSDLVLARNEVARRLRDHDQDATTNAAFERLSGCVGDMRDSITRTRMQPIERLFSALPRLVRDTAAETGKSVQLVIEGADVEIDREMIEQVRDPLIHVVRNAIDHGIELPEVRRARGKSPIGLLTVSARQSGNQVSIEIADDGRGIDVERLLAKAVSADVIEAGAAVALSRDAALQLIFEPGLSTADAVTTISGRGVGMDVARANVERLGGTIALSNRPGEGLSVTLRAPLTLSIMSALIVEAGGQCFAIPRAAIDEIVSTSSAALRLESIGEGHVAVVRGEMLSVVSLGGVLGLDAEPPKRLVIVSPSGGIRYALGIDQARDHEELVVRPIAPQLGALGVFAGQTLPDSGVPLLLLDPLGIGVRAGLDRLVRSASEADIVPIAPPPTILTFEALDGVCRAVRALAIDRIEDVDPSAFKTVGADSFVVLENELHPARLDGPLPATGPIALIRLILNGTLVGYPVRGVSDLVPLGELTPVANDDVEGLVLVDGAAIELVRVDRLQTLPPLQRKRA